MDATTVAGDVDLKEIIRALHCEPGVLPEAAMRQAQARRAAITPLLIEILQRTTQELRAGKSLKHSADLFAMYLLWEFEAQEALQAVIEAVSLPEEVVDSLLGDGVTEDLPRMLAALVGERWDAIDALIRNQQAGEYVRRAAVNAYGHAARDGKISRERAIERLRGHLIDAIANGDAAVVTGLVMELADFAATVALPEIRLAFERDLFDQTMCDLEYLETSLAAGDEGIASKQPSTIADAVEELRWYPYDSKQSGESAPSVVDIYDEADFAAVGPSETIRYDGPHVGRNEPCPCGSGRKFKKCCGSRKNAVELES